MTQPKIEGVGHGKPVMPFGSDGTDWYAILIDTLGHLQVDVVSAALGSGGATETTLLLIKGYVDALETLLAGGLPAALDSGALKVKEQSPITGFATATNQTTMITALQLIDDLRAALGSVNTDDLQVDIKTTIPPVPATPVRNLAQANVATGTWTDLATYTPATGKTLYLCYWAISNITEVAGVEFLGRVTIDDSLRDTARAHAGGSINISLSCPSKVAAGQVAVVEVLQFSGGAKWFSGTLIGFEV